MFVLIYHKYKKKNTTKHSKPTQYFERSTEFYSIARQIDPALVTTYLYYYTIVYNIHKNIKICIQFNIQ